MNPLAKLTIGVLAPMFLILAASYARAAQPAPIVLYVDLLSGPNSGGENDGGCYLSIFGTNFGDAVELGTTTKVFIGGVEVADYRYLGASQGRPDIQQITVQVGRLGNPVPGALLPVEVRVGHVKSTSFTPQTFTVNPGRILFVSLAGNNATAVAGDMKHPWRHVQTGDRALSGAWGAARPGDVIVMRGGLWTDVGFGETGRRFFVKFAGNSGSAAQGTAGTGPIAITSYPNERAVIHPVVDSVWGVIGGVNPRNASDASNRSDSQWITISNLIIATGGINDGPVNLETNSDHWRVINNDLSAPDAVTNRAAGVTGNGKDETVLGNHIHDVAGVGSRGETLLDHGIYIDSGSDWELAYNLIENITGGNGIQLYNSAHVTSTINHVNIHHNRIHNVNKHGLNIADTSGVGISIWSNVVYNTAGGCLRNNSVDLQSERVWNNTFYNCNTSGGDGAVWNDLTNVKAPITIDFRNNIVWPSRASGRYLGGETGFTAEGIRMTASRNTWFGGRDSASFDPGGISADPMFVNAAGNPPDLHLAMASPAKSSGDSAVTTVVNSNFDLQVKAADAAVDRGAY